MTYIHTHLDALRHPRLRVYKCDPDEQASCNCPLCGEPAFSYRADDLPDNAYVDACPEHASACVDDLREDLALGLYGV